MVRLQGKVKALMVLPEPLISRDEILSRCGVAG